MFNLPRDIGIAIIFTFVGLVGGFCVSYWLYRKQRRESLQKQRRYAIENLISEMERIMDKDRYPAYNEPQEGNVMYPFPATGYPLPPLENFAIETMSANFSVLELEDTKMRDKILELNHQIRTFNKIINQLNVEWAFGLIDEKFLRKQMKLNERIGSEKMYGVNMYLMFIKPTMQSLSKYLKDNLEYLIKKGKGKIPMEEFPPL